MHDLCCLWLYFFTDAQIAQVAQPILHSLGWATWEVWVAIINTAYIYIPCKFSNFVCDNQSFNGYIFTVICLL